jgi:hypothetical protein
MFGCMPPRDVLLTVGNEILEATMPIRLLHNSPLASEVRDCVVARAFVQSLIGR